MHDETVEWLSKISSCTQGATPPIDNPSGILFARVPSDGNTVADDGALTDVKRPRLRKVSLKDARGAQPKAAAAPPKPRPSISLARAIEEAAAAPPRAEKPADHKSAAASLWESPGRSLDPDAHGEWSRVSLCEPPPHMKHLLLNGGARVNHAGQPPPPLQQQQHARSGVASPKTSLDNKARAVRRSMDVRRSICGRGMKTGAASRVAGGRGLALLHRSGSPPPGNECNPSQHGPLDAGSMLESQTQAPDISPPKPALKAVQPKQQQNSRLSFNGSTRVSFERGLDALRSSLVESPSAELTACKATPAARDTSSSVKHAQDLHDLHTIGRTLPRVRVTLSGK